MAAESAYDRNFAGPMAQLQETAKAALRRSIKAAELKVGRALGLRAVPAER